MAGGSEDKHSKKHPASDHKKRQLKKKGTVPKSTDVPMAAGLVAALGALYLFRRFYQAHFRDFMEYCIGSIADVGTDEGINITHLLLLALKEVALLSTPVLGAVLVIAVLSNLAQTGFILTGEQLKPNFNKLNPTTKLKQWFSVKSLQELAKSLAKIAAAAYIGYTVWAGSFLEITASVEQDALGLMAIGGKLIFELFWKIILLYLIVGGIDFAFQKKNFLTEHKMTDKEVKDEYKQQEGDPYMKQKRRQMAQQVAMQQATDHVPQADVVVINPTELAIAIKYDPDQSPVPFVLAKGERRLADDIRESARRHGVPVVRNKPLARALYEICEIGDIVPTDLYRSVAEVLAYVFSLREAAAGIDADPVAATAAAQYHGGEPLSASAAGAHWQHPDPLLAPAAVGAPSPFTWAPTTNALPAAQLADLPIYNDQFSSYAGSAHPTGTADPYAQPHTIAHGAAADWRASKDQG